MQYWGNDLVLLSAFLIKRYDNAWWLLILLYFPSFMRYFVCIFQGCLKSNPRERYTMEQLLRHPFLSEKSEITPGE